MALEQRSKIDRIEILDDGQMQIRRLDYVIDAVTGKIVAEIGYHREVVAPGADVSGKDARVQAVARVVHTPSVVAAFAASEETP